MYSAGKIWHIRFKFSTPPRQGSKLPIPGKASYVKFPTPRAQTTVKCPGIVRGRKILKTWIDRRITSSGFWTAAGKQLLYYKRYFFFQFVQALELHNCIVITFHFNSKTLWRWVFLSCDCFCYFTAAMMVPLMEAPTLRLHKFGWNTHEMHELKTTNLGDVVYVSIICIIPDFSLYLMNGQDFFLMKTNNILIFLKENCLAPLSAEYLFNFHLNIIRIRIQRYIILPPSERCHYFR